MVWQNGIAPLISPALPPDAKGFKRDVAVQLADWKELRVTITEGQCPIAQAKRHHRAKLCSWSSVRLL